MTSVLLGRRVKNRASESASHVAVGHWPSSPNYRGPLKSSQPLAVRRPAAGKKSRWVTSRCRRLIEPENDLIARAWAAVVWIRAPACISIQCPQVLTCCNLLALRYLSSLKGVLCRKRIDSLKVDCADGYLSAEEGAWSWYSSLLHHHFHTVTLLIYLNGLDEILKTPLSTTQCSSTAPHLTPPVCDKLSVKKNHIYIIRIVEAPSRDTADIIQQFSQAHKE